MHIPQPKYIPETKPDISHDIWLLQQEILKLTKRITDIEQQKAAKP